MSKTPEIDTHALESLLRHIQGYLELATKYQMHPDETQRLKDATVKAIAELTDFNRQHPPG